MLRGKKWNLCDFSHNSELNYLNLSDNQLANGDLEGLCAMLKVDYDGSVLRSGCPLLKELLLYSNEISDLRSISVLSSLEKINFDDWQLVSLSGIEYLTNLNEISLNNNFALGNVKPLVELMNNIKASDRDSKNLKIFLKGCSSINDDSMKELKDAGVEVIN